MRVLIVHLTPLQFSGGAEISLCYHIENKPPAIEVEIIQPSEPVDLAMWDVVVLGNLRPAGGEGEVSEVVWAELWLERLRNYRGRVIRTERDIHPCAKRDASCVRLADPIRMFCKCGPLIPRIFEALYNQCDEVMFLSPLHQSVINQIVLITSPQTVVAAPIDFSLFTHQTPSSPRVGKALILGDDIRVDSAAEKSARERGYEPERIEYHSVHYKDMPDLLNRYKAVVVRPVMLHAFGRIAIEAMACGCEVIANERVGALSWVDPMEASRRANSDFWSVVLNQRDKQ